MNRIICVVVGATVGFAPTSPASAQFGNLVKVAGTAGARLLLKDPIDKKCTDAGLKNCQDITEGLLLYAEGKPEDGKPHLRTAALANSPDQVQTFATAITAIGDIPGTAKYLGPVLDAARFLAFTASAGGAPSSPSAVADDSGNQPSSRSAMASAIDMDRLLGGMATPLANPSAVRCGAGGIAASCVRVASGPMLLTGVYFVGQCPEVALALSADSNGDMGAPRWAVTVSRSQPVLNGAQLLVPVGQSLFVGLSGKAAQQQCAITWSGSRLSGTGSAVPEPMPSAPPVVATSRTEKPLVAPTPVIPEPTTVGKDKGKRTGSSSDETILLGVKPQTPGVQQPVASAPVEIPLSARAVPASTFPSVRVEVATAAPDVRTTQPTGVDSIAASDGPHAGGDIKTSQKSGLEYVYIPAGSFHFGCEPQDGSCGDDEKPGRTATVHALWVGKTDVTVAAYQRCVDDKGCTEPKAGSWSNNCNYGKRPDHPVNCVDWNQASAFCAWSGGTSGRLPTAEEWEYVAKGGESRIYPWGNEEPNQQLVYTAGSQDGTESIGRHPGGASKMGVLDLEGNVWQWTGSDYDSGSKEIRGGGRDGRAKHLRSSCRDNRGPSRRSDEIGFRCVM